jgi:hypothetical protein
VEATLQHTGLLVLHDHLQAHPFHTTILFWDCECETDYIHPLTEDECFVCHTKRESQPPARVNEIMRQSSRLPRGLIQVIDEMLAFLELDESPIPF